MAVYSHDSITLEELREVLRSQHENSIGQHRSKTERDRDKFVYGMALESAWLAVMVKVGQRQQQGRLLNLRLDVELEQTRDGLDDARDELKHSFSSGVVEKARRIIAQENQRSGGRSVVDLVQEGVGGITRHDAITLCLAYPAG